MELSESVSVPQASWLLEKSSWRRTLPVLLLIAVVAVGGGAVVGGIGLAVSVGRGVSVASRLAAWSERLDPTNPGVRETARRLSP